MPLARSTPRPVLVDGQPKGVVFRLAGRWRWQRGAGMDTFPREYTLEHVKMYLRRVCRGDQVTINSEAK